MHSAKHFGLGLPPFANFSECIRWLSRWLRAEWKEGMLLSAVAPQGALTDMPQLHFSLHPYTGTQLQQILPAH